MLCGVRACVRALACACACHPVYVCAKRETRQERERVSEGKIQQDVKGAEGFSAGREGKGKSEGAVELKVGWWGRKTEGGTCRLPTAPCSTLQAHTLTSKWYPYMPEA